MASLNVNDRNWYKDNISNAKIKNSNALLGSVSFFNWPTNDNSKTYENIRNIKKMINKVFITLYVGGNNAILGNIFW